MKQNKLKLLLPDFSQLDLPIGQTRVRAGFPSPAADYAEERIDLNKILIMHPSATFYAIAEGDSMRDAGVFSGDLLVIDRAIPPNKDDIVLCFLNGEFTLKKIERDPSGKLSLVSENPDFQPIPVSEEDDFRIWGTLSCSIKKHSRWLHW